MDAPIRQSQTDMLNLMMGRALLRWLDSLADRPAADVEAIAPESAAQSQQSAAPAPAPPPLVYPRVSQPAMGSLFEVYLAGVDRERLLAAAEEALDEIQRLDRQLSHYRDDSDISRLNCHAAEQWVRLEPRLYHLLRRCAEIGSETEGAFDITMGPLDKAWGFFRGQGSIPEDEEIAYLLSRTGAHRLIFDDEDGLVRFSIADMEINLGAVGKGYAIDEAADRLRFYGVDAALIHGGQSTIYALGAPPAQDGWELAIKDPRDRQTVIQPLRLRDEAISTSGSYEQFFEADGVRYSHILDPRIGRPVQGMLSVSVVAPSAAESDALSTAFYVMGRERTQEFCAARPNIRVVMMEETPDGEVRVTRMGFAEEEHYGTADSV